MKFNIQTLRESLNHPKSGKKVFTEGKKQNVILSEEQLDRLLLQLNESREKSITSTIKDAHQLIREAIKNENLDLSVRDYSGTIIKEDWYTKDAEEGATYTKDAEEGATYDLGEQGMYDRNPGIAAGEGLENVLNGIKKAYDMIKDSDTRKKLANSITKLGNFMTYTAELVGSGSSQRAPRSYDQVSNPLPHPELETVTVDDEIEDEISEDVDEDDGDEVEDIQEQKEKLIREDIKKMKQIIKPITKI